MGMCVYLDRHVCTWAGVCVPGQARMCTREGMCVHGQICVYLGGRVYMCRYVCVYMSRHACVHGQICVFMSRVCVQHTRWLSPSGPLKEGHTQQSQCCSLLWHCPSSLTSGEGVPPGTCTPGAQPFSPGWETVCRTWHSLGWAAAWVHSPAVLIQAT